MDTRTWQDSEEGLSPDWIFSNNSNVHACNDRKWFTDFTPFPSHVDSATFTGRAVPVEGVGAVNLPVKRGPNVRGPQAHHIVRLTNVLYVPSSVCNIVGMPIFESGVASVSMGRGPNSKGSLEDRNGSPVAYFSPNARLLSLRLSGPPIGPRLAPSKFDPDTLYAASINWPREERARWEAQVQQGNADNGKDQWIGDQPYTDEEKAWVKKHFGNEFRLLMLYGLSIHDEEDRAEGRAIARSFMRADAEREDDEMDQDDDDDEEEEEEEEDENDFERHLADHHFDAQQLDWIEENYRDSATFMYSFGLKFYDDDDCEQAKAIVRSFMSN
ncbi:uncharacterized protein TRIREDRAFT_121125 [Trichoderma reesei QM6a]|uniref:Predicted protein n=2 Tax=Hypocrea jecorina TaxID=51453 RepID=G0RG20_HYPJQ|nr:uncharacterized protein TRIREDRAFT_121125 [Trichoderma reesei QM6a]EGR49887.1 predicted protein [Trichoderma reesei QM6a]ETS03190.1 hypothetical protein M419DRAFT_108873 [Trichoderma reesei RUT C-30]